MCQIHKSRKKKVMKSNGDGPLPPIESFVRTFVLAFLPLTEQYQAFRNIVTGVIMIDLFIPIFLIVFLLRNANVIRRRRKKELFSIMFYCIIAGICLTFCNMT